jgi:hypothetical protein
VVKTERLQLSGVGGGGLELLVLVGLGKQLNGGTKLAASVEGRKDGLLRRGEAANVGEEGG